MSTRYGVWMVAGRVWWAYDRLTFVKDPIAARWFVSAREAELAALRDLPDRRDAWDVRSIPTGSLD